MMALYSLVVPIRQRAWRLFLHRIKQLPNLTGLLFSNFLVNVYAYPVRFMPSVWFHGAEFDVSKKLYS